MAVGVEPHVTRGVVSRLQIVGPAEARRQGRTTWWSVERRESVEGARDLAICLTQGQHQNQRATLRYKSPPASTPQSTRTDYGRPSALRASW